MSDANRSPKDREAAAKLAQKRVEDVERHFGEICTTLGSITRKNARLRNKGDLLARNLISLAESEKINSTLQSNVLQFAENYAAVQDYCHAKVLRLETKVLKPLTKYGEKCRYVKRGIKSEISACGKEKKVVQKLEKLQEKSGSQSQIAQVTGLLSA
ncbi:CBY1-interacting BAR domain-containing protein 2-like [Babylonia areolata]|uniref:CBY1-interacting BAR domain-containing protein 2-like n=1 Tax=Babylonia areolata TaxID=304850 RepID=UPI003FD32968